MMPSFTNGDGQTNLDHLGECQEVLQNDAIAIVGMACCFPQDAENCEGLWDMLLNGRSAVSEFPKSKMNVDAHYHPDPAYGGSMSCKAAHFLKHNGSKFDAPFFSITKNEALAMDPQQRILMENVYKALENAGMPMDSIIGTETCVYVGAFTNDYQNILNTDPEMLLKYAPTGNSNSILSNRVSWFYDFKGCSLTVDTACSSSLVAFHLACQNIKEKGAKMAIVSGVNIIEYPQAMFRMSNIGFLSPDGKCYSFDHRANGYSRGEGVGTIILKPLHAAVTDGNTIRAIVRATGVNQDGRTPGMTLPSKSAQERLIRSVYSAAGLDLAVTSYVEAHGTGTAAGDPVEAGAIAAAWSERKSETPLYVGAIKSNIGHLEGASGVAGIIKAVLALEKAIIPPNINFEKVNPKIFPEKWNIEFPLRPIPWPNIQVRRASVNSFGFGGTNAHVVLDDARSFLMSHDIDGKHASAVEIPFLADPVSIESDSPQNSDSVPNTSVADVYSNGVEDSRNSTVNGHNYDFEGRKSHLASRVFILSSSDEGGIKRTIEEYHRYLSAKSPLDEHQYLNDLAYTLAMKRTIFPWKSFVVAGSLSELVKRLPDASKRSRHTRKGSVPKVGFVFTGQGAQWHAMGRELLIYPVFRRSLEMASTYLSGLCSPWDLMDELLKDRDFSNINHPILSQAACTALQVALVDLLASWNILPSRVIGHSSGEIGAAYCAGAINREAAWRIAYYRGVVSAKLIDRNGAMMAVRVDQETLLPYLQKVNSEMDGELVMACFNSPKNITISGDVHMVDRLGELLKEEEIFGRKLKVQNAYHSSHMRTVAEEYQELMGDISAGFDYDQGEDQQVLMFSTVSCLRVSLPELRNPQYWISNMISPVRFVQGLSEMCSTASGEKSRLRVDRGTDLPLQHLLEIGPHPALNSAIRETLGLEKRLSTIEYSCLVSRDNSSLDLSLQTAGILFCKGYPVDLFSVNCSPQMLDSPKLFQPQMVVDFPPYSFNHTQTYWPESRLSKNFRFRKFPRHDLLGAPVPDWNLQDPKWRHIIRVSENPWLKDHKVTGRMVYPGVGYVVMAIEAAAQLEAMDAKVTGFRLRDISIRSALQVPDTERGVETMLTMRHTSESSVASSTTWREFKVSSYNPNTEDWTEHCRGSIKIEYDSEVGPIDAGREAAAEARAFHAQLDDVIKTCSVPVDMTRSYSELETIGLSFGPLFKNLTNVLRGNGTGNATGFVKIPDIRASMPKRFTHPHFIHPTTMDSMLHIFLAAIQDSIEGTRIGEPMVPVLMKEVWVAIDIANEPDHTFRSHGRANKVSHNKFEASITVWDATTEMVKVLFRGIQLKPIQSDSVTSGKRQISYNIEWRPDIDLVDPSQIRAHIREEASPVEINKLDLIQLGQDFNLAAIIYITDALKDLQGDPLESLPQHHKQYLAWLHLQDERFRNGLILHQKPEWNSIMNDSNLKEQHLRRVAESGAEGKLTARMGSNLVSILRQEVDALQLMFGDELLDSYYREIHGTESIHRLLQSYFAIYSHKYASLKVLEIGAGTGGTTLPIIEALCPRDKHSKLASYTYTDISPGFFEKAKEKFKNWRHVLEFRRLDIEKDPMSQGFEQGHYDIIIAANVLHATADLNKTLVNVSSLLRPGGKLILHEGVQIDILQGPLAFGTLPGWWLSVEPFRKWSPLLSEPEWNGVLLQSGFSGIDIVLKDYDDENLHAQSLMVSTPVILTSPPENVHETIIVVSASEAIHPLVVTVRAAMERNHLPEAEVIHYRELQGRNLKQVTCIVLLEVEDSKIFSADADFNIIRNLLATCAGALWVTGNPISNPENSLATGLIRTVRWERDLDDPNLVILGIEHPSQSIPTCAAQILQVYQYQFLQQNFQRNAEYNSFGGIININRLVPADYLDDFLFSKVSKATAHLQPYEGDPTRALVLATDTPGLLNKLQFVDCPKHGTELALDEVEVRIKATGLNFRDIMSAMGEVGGDVFGAEGAGIVVRVGASVQSVKVDDRVVLLASRTGCFQTFARSTDAAVARIPDNMTFEAAAGMPVIFCTAYYCLVDIARLQKGESILIHAAAGGVGQAAIMLAQSIGAEVFATVSTEEKRKILVDTYNIPESHILSSRDLSFAKGLMRLTNNVGVDVILNSLAGEALRVTWECIAPFGRFIEIGKRDIYANGRLEMFPFSKSVTFSSCDLETVMRLDPNTTSRLLRQTMALWENGTIRETMPFNIFDYSQIEESFRLLQSGKHIGKVVLTPHKDDIVPIVPKPQTPYLFPENVTYVLAGGLGGLGRSIARWMVSRGARHLVFLSRKGASSDAARELVEDLRENGCMVNAVACDVSDRQALEQAISECEKSMPPIKGCIQGAMQLKDSAFENMSWENFKAAIAPKVDGSWNLHTTLPKDMDFFIMLSSICGVIGNRGQSNYAAGNVYQDALAQYRIKKGLPATALDLGSMLSVGFIAENQTTVSSHAFAMDSIREDEFHTLLEYHIDPRNITCTPLRCQVAIGLASRTLFQQKGIPEPSFMRDPLFTHLRSISEHSTLDGEDDSFVATREALRAAKTLEDAAALITETLVKRISSIMSIPIEDIDSGKPIHFYGVDSLVAVEFRNWLAKNIEATIEVLDIMGNDSISNLAEKIAKTSKIIKLEDEKVEGDKAAS